MTEQNKGKVVGINGNLVSVEFDGTVSMNEICYVKVDDATLKSEVIRIRGKIAQVQVYEMTDGIQYGDEVIFTGEMLSAMLGPGLLGQVFDGLQNPLPALAEQAGWFLKRGIYLEALDTEKKWAFTPTAQPGAVLRAGEAIGSVPEGGFVHKIFVPFDLLGTYTLKSIVAPGEYNITETIAVLSDERGREIPVSMSFRWPVKRAVKCYRERLAPVEIWRPRYAWWTLSSRWQKAAHTVRPDRLALVKQYCSTPYPAMRMSILLLSQLAVSAPVRWSKLLRNSRSWWIPGPVAR